MDDIRIRKYRYDRKWKTMQLKLARRPSGLSEWLWLAWGFDIFLHEIPVLKTIVAANVLVWLLFV